MKYKALIFCLLSFCFTLSIFAQSDSEEGRSSVVYALADSTNGRTLMVPPEGLQVKADGDGMYTKGQNRYITVNNYQVACSSPYVLTLNFSLFDIAKTDTLIVYDGPSTDYPVLLKCNNSLNNLNQGRSTVYASSFNNQNLHALTICFKTASNSDGGAGFLFSVECLKPCEVTTPHIANEFERIRNGQAYATDTFRHDGEQRVIPICAGDGVRIKGYGEYTSFTGHYRPNDGTSTFRWILDDEGHVTQGVGYNYVTYKQFDTLSCHSLILEMTDGNGCKSTLFDQVQLRVSVSPIKSIANLGTICNRQELLVKVSYDSTDQSSYLLLDSVAITNVHSRVNSVKTFIPDGPYCSTRCYQAPVTFSDFPLGQTLEDKGDICSICVNYEHTYMGDYDLQIVCPSGRKATLKYKDNPGGKPAGAYGGGGIYTGYPYGGSSARSWDGGSGQYCDSTYNMYGEGLDYCFSRNGEYLLVDGRQANTTSGGDHYLANSSYMVSVTHQFSSVPSHIRGSNAGSRTFNTKRPSDHANKVDYYMPADDFSTLVGCPLNGIWQIQICDNWALDNGWVFNWSMDICSAAQQTPCKYNVGVDSITWDIKPESGRSKNATVRVDRTDSLKFYMSAYDTAGRFYANIHVFDEYGCQWDSLGYFDVLWMPKPELGDNVEFCRSGTASFEALDPHTYGKGYRYSYMWNTGDTTPVIVPTANQTQEYTVEVTNMSIYDSTTRCIGRDTVSIVVGVFPESNFLPEMPGNQCSPYTMAFANTSKHANTYRWDFGDGTQSTDDNPRHTYSAGTYTVTLYSFTRDGCRDTLRIPNYIHVIPPIDVAYPAMMCEGRSYTWLNGVTYDEPTTAPTIVLKSVDGCDSILHLNLGVDNVTEARIHAVPEVATADNPVVCLFDNGINSVMRTWWLPDGTTSNDVQACFSFPSDDDSVRVIVAIESEYGCRDTTSSILYIDRSQVYMPNVFTPGRPNNNRVRMRYNQIDQAQCDIYNRNGYKVYSFADKDDEWDGTYNGTPCPQGAYVYIIRYTTQFDTDRWQVKKGAITLLR